VADTKKPNSDSDSGPVVDTSPDKNKVVAAGIGKKGTSKAKPARKPKIESPAPPSKAEKEPTAPDVVEKTKGTAKLPELAPVETKKRGGFSSALIGGFLAACLGFLAARTEVLDPKIGRAHV